MKITLVTASFNDLVHGTFNYKKTGCGINLLKPDNASRFHQSGEMSFLGQITCEKCKSKIAKEMIKADSKEMKALLKEEKIRAKKGLEDEGLVALSTLEVKPTSRPVEPEPRRAEPEPEPAPSNNQVGYNGYSDDLSQFAIEKPQPQAYEPEPQPEYNTNADDDDFLAQFSIKKPEEPQYEEPEEDDFLAQFSIQKPEEPQYEEPQGDDFLAQFSISSEPQNDYQPETPAQPPVIDDISEALAAMQNVNVHNKPAQAAAPADDFLSMFSINNAPAAPEPATDNRSVDEIINSYEKADEGIFDSMDSTENTAPADEWDIIANQVFSGSQPAQPPVLDDISAPSLDDISIDDIIAPALSDISTPELEDLAPPPTPQLQKPVAPQTPPPAPQAVKPQTPPPAPQAAKPQMTPPVQPQMTPPPVAPQPKPQMTPPPAPQPQPQMAPPVQPQMAPPPVAPQPQMAMTPPPAATGQAMAAGIGQIITVPQLTGYDQNGQPMYAYAQMIMQGYDPNGQPILMPLPAQAMMGMPMGIPAMPMQTAQPDYSSLNKNSRLQAVLDSLDEPVSEKDMTVGQKIAAANAAKGSPVSANVSKIATNEHTKAANQAFISAISESKEATQSLTETQGIKPKGVVLDSIEDVLSQLGDNSLKEKKEAQAKMQQKEVTAFSEFKIGQRPTSSFSRPVPSSSRTSAPDMMDMPLTRSQMKDKKKQDKIDAKFQKEMAKRKK